MTSGHKTMQTEGGRMRVARAISVTDVGRRMKDNEDAVLKLPQAGLYAVADGTGGTEPAEIALATLRDRQAVLQQRRDEVVKQPSTASRLSVGRFFEDVFARAGQAVAEAAERLARPRMATTLVAATIVDRFCYVAHVGNSRAYLFRNDELWALTSDHTVAVAQYRQGQISLEECRASPFQKTLTQAIGITPRLDVEFAEIWLAPGDVILLCSDGLHRLVPEDAIANALALDDLADGARSLVRQAQEAGAPDNVSVVLLHIEAEDASPTRSNVAATLREVFLFQPLSESERMIIAPYLEEVIFEPHETLIRTGDDGDCFYVVISGRVRVSRGKTHLTDIGAGGHLGELALARRGKRTATVTAVERTRTFALSRERFHELIRAKPELGIRLLMPLMDRMGDRLGDLTDRLMVIERAVQGQLPR